MSGEDGEERQAALRLAGQAYFDRVLNETAGKSKMNAADGGSGTGYAMGINSESNSSKRKAAGGQYERVAGGDGEPLMDEEDENALNFIEETIIRSKGIMLLTVFTGASAIAIVLLKFGMPMIKSTGISVWVHQTMTAVAMVAVQSMGTSGPGRGRGRKRGLTRPPEAARTDPARAPAARPGPARPGAGMLTANEAINFDAARFTAAVVPGIMYSTAVHQMWEPIRMLDAVYIITTWVFWQCWVVYGVKVFITGDFVARLPASYEERSSSAAPGGLDGGDGREEPEPEEKDYSADFVPQRNSALAIFKQFGVVIRRAYQSDFYERWAMRAVTVGWVLLSAVNEVSLSSPKKIARPQYYTFQFLLPLIAYHLYETPKQAGRPLAFHYTIEGRRPVLLNDAEKMFYMNAVGGVSTIILSYYKNNRFLTDTSPNMPTINMALMLAGCVVACNVCFLLSKQYVRSVPPFSPHSRTHALTHSLTHSLAHSLTHSLTH